MIDQASLLLGHQVCMCLAGRTPCSGDMLSREGDLGGFHGEPVRNGPPSFSEATFLPLSQRPCDQGATAFPSAEPLTIQLLVY